MTQCNSPRWTPATPAGYLLAICLPILTACSSDPAGETTAVDPPTATTCASSETESTVTLSCPYGSAVITRSPFGLRFLDPAGKVVLETVETIQQGPSPLIAVDSFPIGNQSLPPPIYAPISYAVGVDPVLQYIASPFVADLLLRLTAGVEYAAGDVMSFSGAEENAITARLGGQGPANRALTVRIGPDPSGPAFRVAVEFDDGAGIAVTSLAFKSGDDEAFYGFGGRRNALDQAGEVFFNWLEQLPLRPDSIDPILDALPTLGPNTQLPNQAQSAYYVQTSFISSRPFGFWLERDTISEFRLKHDRPDAWQARVGGAGTAFVVTLGDSKQAIRTLTGITGRNPVPARWHLGPIFSRTLTGGPVKDGATYYAEMLDDLEQIDTLDLPYKAFLFEAWPLVEEAGLYQEAIDAIRAKGLRPMTYIRAFASNDGFGYERRSVFFEALAGGYFATLPGSPLPYLVSGTFGPQSLMGVIDFTKPSALAWWEQRVTDILDSGSEGFMHDFGEQAFVDMHFHNGQTGATMHNRYPVIYHSTTREIVDRWLARNPERDAPLFFVRSGYSGRPGSAAFEGGNWSGDNTTDWSRASGLGSVIPDMLNRSIGGAWGFHSDTGGYFDAFGPATKELFIRWSWLASLAPLNRLHGGPISGLHTPWSFDEETVDLHRASLQLRAAAEPLIHQLWEEAVRTGIPFNRPMWLVEPEWPGVGEIDQQWMLGDDVLIAPVVTEGATSKQVFFPRGCWQRPETGERYEGPVEEVVAAPIHQLPYFFRCGTRPFKPPTPA